MTKKLVDEVLEDTPALEPDDVAVPEWRGRVVRLPRLDALERIELSEWLHGAHPKDRELTTPEKAISSARLLTRILTDPENGEPCFPEDKAEFLARRHIKVVNRLVARFNEINGWGKKEVDEAAGKSPAAGSAATPTDSPPSSGSTT